MKRILVVAFALLGIAVAYSWYTDTQVATGPVTVDAVGFLVMGA